MSNGKPGYRTVTAEYDGHTYTFTFYEGFVSELNLRPRGSRETIQVYKQQGVFKVPGGGAPEARTTLTIQGGPDDLDIELDVNDAPNGSPSYTGPIDGFNVRTRKNGPPFEPSERRVTPSRGANQVASIYVRMKGAAAAGAAGRGRMFDGGGSGDDVDVSNSAETCPPNCNP